MIDDMFLNKSRNFTIDFEPISIVQMSTNGALQCFAFIVNVYCFAVFTRHPNVRQNIHFRFISIFCFIHLVQVITQLSVYLNQISGNDTDTMAMTFCYMRRLSISFDCVSTMQGLFLCVDRFMCTFPSMPTVRTNRSKKLQKINICSLVTVVLVCVCIVTSDKSCNTLLHNIYFSCVSALCFTFLVIPLYTMTAWKIRAQGRKVHASPDAGAENRQNGGNRFTLITIRKRYHQEVHAIVTIGLLVFVQALSIYPVLFIMLWVEMNNIGMAESRRNIGFPLILLRSMVWITDPIIYTIGIKEFRQFNFF